MNCSERVNAPRVPKREEPATESLSARVRAAADDGTPLAIAGGGTKDFLGRLTQAERFDVSAHRGIVTYEPTELVLSARGGTPLAEVRAALDGRMYEGI